jgi:adenylosuccinate lyase
MIAWEEQRSFRALVESDPAITAYLSAEELAECFDPSWHLKHVDTIFARLGLAAE